MWLVQDVHSKYFVVKDYFISSIRRKLTASYKNINYLKNLMTIFLNGGVRKSSNFEASDLFDYMPVSKV